MSPTGIPKGELPVWINPFDSDPAKLQQTAAQQSWTGCHWICPGRVKMCRSHWSGVPPFRGLCEHEGSMDHVLIYCIITDWEQRTVIIIQWGFSITKEAIGMFSSSEHVILITAEWDTQAHKSIPTLISVCWTPWNWRETCNKSYVTSLQLQPVPCRPLKILLVTVFWWFWRRQWHPTPVLLPGKSHGRRSLVGCSPWCR